MFNDPRKPEFGSARFEIGAYTGAGELLEIYRTDSADIIPVILGLAKERAGRDGSVRTGSVFIESEYGVERI